MRWMRFNSILLFAVRFNAPNVANATLRWNAYFFFLMPFPGCYSALAVWVVDFFTVVHKSVGLEVVLQFVLYQEGSELVTFSVVQF